MRVAIIGTGIAGNAAAWALSQRYPVTVYERELRPGGHNHTVTVDYDGTPVAVDTGFIAYNEVNYPGFTAMLGHLGVETVESCMSFAVTADAGRFEWKGGGDSWPETAKCLFAQPGNLLSHPVSYRCDHRQCDTAALARTFVALPLVTFKIMAAIHWEALRLWLKGARIMARPTAKDSSAEQRPAHASRRFGRRATSH